MKICCRCKIAKDESRFTTSNQNADGLHPRCKDCSNELNRERHAISDRSKHAEIVGRWRLANPEKTKEINKASYSRNSTSRKKESAEYRKANIGYARMLSRLWAKKNAVKMRMTNAARRAAKKNAIPAWAKDEFDSFAVKEAYTLARLRSNMTGITWHVDHIVPLRNNRVCGFHCAANIQVITALENHTKGNRMWPEMWQNHSSKDREL